LQNIAWTNRFISAYLHRYETRFPKTKEEQKREEKRLTQDQPVQPLLDVDEDVILSSLNDIHRAFLTPEG
jgi:hypothetical protein